MQEIGLYIHIPFCKSKCAYCNFYSLPGQEKQIPLYFDCLTKELTSKKELLINYEISSIYFGGGTPSMVDSKYICEILTQVKHNFHLSKSCEITIEANPETIAQQSLTNYLKAGFNRLSIGVQASQDHLLKEMGRHYTFAEFVEKYQLARKVGFKNINLDLIFGLPKQTLADWQESLTKITALHPEHIACYSLELDNDSFWGRLEAQGKLKKLPSDFKNRKMNELAIETLTKSGYLHYEISNYAKINESISQLPVCRHNLNFWLGKPYLGIGAGAHSCVNQQRFSNPDSIHKYCQLSEADLPINTEVIKLSTQDQIQEFLLLRLRLLAGFTSKEFSDLFGESAWLEIKSRVDKLAKKRLLRTSLNSDTNCLTILLTKKGLNLYNQVVIEIIYN